MNQELIIWAVAVLILAIAVLWLLGKLRIYLSRFLKRGLAQSDRESVAKGLDLLLTILLLSSRVFVLATAILYVADLFPISREISNQARSILSASFISPILTIGRSSYSVANLLILGSLLFGLILLVKAITNLLRERVLTLAGLSRGAEEAIAIITQYSLLFIGILVLLQIWGLDLSSLTILASALGIGLGIGLQDIAKNFGSGLILIFERPIQVGDFIEVGKLNGTVERIGARSTEIRTLDRVSIIVPNSRFLDSEVINWSHRNPISRLHVPVGVAYGSNLSEVRDSLLEAAQNCSQILTSPSCQVLFKGFGDSSLDFELLVWIDDPSKQFLVKSDLYFLIYEILSKQNIEIPFPQRDLHLRSGKLELSPNLETAIMSAIRKEPTVT
ncbi:MAG: mechanosensitive ion channel [Pseudanabaenaceae cyanobacterium bins.39]|nr:mechanosensitive ion channel [Pseudanabaenaceae cyanobacterium bins.39]